jgi:hypothetical protein
LCLWIIEMARDWRSLSVMDSPFRKVVRDR